MKAVWKYELPRLNSIRDGQFCFKFTIPQGGKVRHAAYVGPKAYMWVEVNPENPKNDREFFCVGTGHGAVLPGSEHLATLIEDAVGLVWHIYEKV